MGINHLQLSPEIIAALYPEILVGADEPDTPKKRVNPKMPIEKAETVYPFLGKNLRSICFLVDYPEHEFMPEEQQAFLHKILTACKCSFEDIALVNTAGFPVLLDTIKSQLQPRIIFLWGAMPSIFSQTPGIRDMTVSHVDEILIVPVLQAEKMGGDSKEGLALKQQLWVLLKKLFTL
jgi:hypothetical protein